MSEYIYESDGDPLANARGEVALARREIVRCKDCKLATVDGYSCSRFDYCDVEPDGFCKWGEPITANGGNSEAVR